MDTLNKQIKIEAIITYVKNSTNSKQILMTTMIDKDVNSKKLVDVIINGLLRFKKIDREHIIKIDCSNVSAEPLELFKEDNGNYFQFNKKWFKGYGKKMPNEFLKEL